MSKYQVERRDNYILGLSFGRSLAQNGQPMVSVRDIQFDDKGSVEYAVFDGVDVRSEGLVDQFVSKFQQVNLDFEHRFNDNFSMNARAGRSLSRWDGPMRLQTFLDAIDVDNFTLDFRGGRETPLIGFGNLNLSDPNSFSYGPPLADATVLGGFSTQGKPSENITDINTFELSGDWQMTEMFGLKVGAQYRENDFDTPRFEPRARVRAGYGAACGRDAGRHHDADRGSGRQVRLGSAGKLGGGRLARLARRVQLRHLSPFCNVECGANKSGLLEEVTTGYVRVHFQFGRRLGIPIRGDLGVRYVQTDQFAMGHVPVPAPMGAPYPNVGQRTEVETSYNDTLPSLNLVAEFTPDLLMRLSASKVIAACGYHHADAFQEHHRHDAHGHLQQSAPRPDPREDGGRGSRVVFRSRAHCCRWPTSTRTSKPISSASPRPTVYNTLGLPDALLAARRRNPPRSSTSVSSPRILRAAR